MENKDIKLYKKEIFAIESILFDLGYDKIEVSGYLQYIHFEFKLSNSNVFDTEIYDEIKTALKKFNVKYQIYYVSDDMKYFMEIKLYDKGVTDYR